MVSHWSLSDWKSPQVSSILVDLNNAVAWMLPTHPLISKFFSPCTNLFVTLPNGLMTTGIAVTFLFHSFFSSLARSTYLSLSLSFTLSQPEQQLFGRFSFLLIISRSGRLAEIMWSICILKFQRSLWCHSPRQILDCAYTACLHG